ncbi:MAG: class I SAM-dependent methyltransferase, partial [Ornithinimicrobium sp.]
MFEAPYTRLAEVYDAIVVDDCYSAWADYLDQLWGTEGVPVSRVLDLCCGTGLLAEQLMARGHHVTGADASADMLDQARKRLGTHAPLYRSVLTDLPDAINGEPFDAVVATFY